jgi:hypothetical protein
MKREAFCIVLAVLLTVSAFGAQRFIMNPHTGKLDAIGGNSQDIGYSKAGVAATDVKGALDYIYENMSGIGGSGSTMANYTTLAKIGTGTGNSPTWRGGAWPGISAAAINYKAYSTVVGPGSIAYGNYSSTWKYDSSNLRINEVTGTPGYTVELLYKNIATFNKVQVHEWYNGSVAHSVDIQLYNYVNAGWDTLETITDQSNLVAKVYNIISATPYLSGSNARLRFNHSTAGTGTHYLLLDYAALTQDSGSGVSEHGLLTGLADDDHVQYALADGTRGILPATSVNYGSTTVSAVLDLLAPAPPPNLSTRTLSIASTYTARESSTGTARSGVINSTTPTIDCSGAFYNGDSGTLTALIDGSMSDSRRQRDV